MYADCVSAAPRGRRLYLCLDLVTASDRDATPPHPDVHYHEFLFSLLLLLFRVRSPFLVGPTLTSGSGMYEVVLFSDSKAMFTLLHLKVKPMSTRVIKMAANPAVRSILWRLTNDLVVCRKDIHVNGSTNGDVIIFYTCGEDCSSACTDCQLSSRPAPQKPVNVPSHNEMPSLSAVKPPPSRTLAKRPRASSHALPPPKPPLFTPFKSTAAANPGPSSAAFSPRTQAHRYVGLSASLLVHELSAVRQALREAETCVIILRSRVAALESIENVDF
ncbi:hypothetical protein AJ78_08978 [Emergomyces pasteurianus Ep9510]|uniref:Uncharacterized protein n=1 Tax=Emergomyces pasteurianus Ep9510 TaxID=1447872 RepID=A0A1J9P1H5_9EURO|nr:hypothetical protein AJ78_08978 [Emergomyces pasteurianus Ep9510]